MTWPHFSFNVDLGQGLTTAAFAAMTWAVRRLYKFCVREVARVQAFVDRVNENDDLLEATTAVVDDHTRVLVKAKLIALPVVRLKRRRRFDDPAVFTEDNLS